MITNNINGRTYIGVHKTDDLDDGYMGSGKVLKRAINKHGIENFTKTILAIFDNAEEMFEMERSLVTASVVKDNMTYNLIEGGHGGFSHINEKLRRGEIDRTESSRRGGYTTISKHKDLLDAGYQRHLDLLNNDVDYRKEFIRKCRHDTPTFLGKKHTEETKRRIGEATSRSQSGKGNSNYGNVWMFHTRKRKNIRVPKDEMTLYEEQGWQRGRRMKYNKG